MSNSLKLLYSEHDELIQSIIDQGGEVTPELEEKLKQLPAKVDACDAFLAKCDHALDRIDAKLKEYQAAKKAVESRKEWLKDYIKHVMIANCETRLEGNEVVITIQKTAPSVFIANELDIDTDYLRFKTISEIDKKRIKEDLLLGVPVKGAVLKEGYSLKIKTKKGI